MAVASAAPGADRLAQAKNPPGLPLRLLCAARLRDVLSGSNFVPFSAAEIADGRDRALANRLVNTALRRHGHLNLVIGHLLDRGIPKKSGTFEAVLRLSLAQLLYLPELGAHSALFLAVEATKRDDKSRHLSGLMNAALRRAQGEAATLREAPRELLFPEDVRRRWREAYGPEALVRFADALLAGAALDLTLKDDYPALIELLGAEPLFGDVVRLATRDKPVEQLPGYAEGRWWVQDAAASLPARFIGVPAGSSVLDLCAAPGGKTAQLVKAGYAVTALDLDRHRTERLRENLRRLHYEARIVEADGTAYRPAEPFDAVLLDAPCSATGTFRRHPEVIWHRRAGDIAGRVTLQRRFIGNAVNCLKSNGVLVYCVCSLEPEEGEEQLDWIARTHPELVPDPIGPQEVVGLPAGALAPAGYLRSHPAMAVGRAESGAGDQSLDGFFVARFRRH
jgi:16S rRNA (cytosine967-C5)-methyltransferase